MRSGGLDCVWSPPSVPQHDRTTHGRRPHNRILCGRRVCAVVRSAFSITGPLNIVQYRDMKHHDILISLLGYDMTTSWNRTSRRGESGELLTNLINILFVIAITKQYH